MAAATATATATATAAGTTLGIFPFTSEQWKELETQAMIYKYMMSSLPVPPDLLFPTITRYLSHHHHHPSPVFSSNSTLVRGYLRFPKGKDQEPWRCKRTDGKKWRCAKYVAHDQKYCERHMHRGRPRSRKPVEQQQLHHHSDLINNNNSKKGRFQSNVAVLPPNPMLSNSRVVSGNVGRILGSSTTTTSQAQPYIGNPVFLDRSDEKACDFDSVVSVSSLYKEPRKMDWKMKGEAVTVASTSATDQQWQQHLMQTKTGLMATNQNSYSNSNSNTSIFNQNYEVEPLNFVDSEGPNNETPRSFIDAWSNEEMNDKNGNFSNNDSVSVSVSSNGKLSLSSLNLLMGSKNTINDEMGHLQMGLGLIESDHHQNQSYGGGPLGEVLRPAAAGSSASNPEFLMGGNVDSDSPQATTVSSPSGVLQKTLASFSDSSNCSSPTTTLVASRVKPEIAFQWLN